MTWKQFDGSSIRTASDEPLPILGYTDASVVFRGKTRTIRFYVIPQLANEIYFGIDFWAAFDLLPKLDELAVAPAVISEEEAENKEEKPDMHTLNNEQRRRLGAVIALFPSCEAEGLGRTSIIKHKIDVGNATPTKQRYYAVSPAVEKRMFDEVDRMLELGVIEESFSAWNSPVTCVTKSNGKTRLCLDARKVNAVTIKDAYPMPLIESILSRLNETYYISSVDLKDAFWQIELDTTSRDKTAFTVPGRPLYQFTRMPFGLCNAAQTMCRLMDAAIPSILRGSVFVYIDDLLVVSSDFETHLKRLEVVARSLRKANLTINVDKSKFVMKSIRYLGHIIGNGEIKADPNRVQAITEFPSPKTIRQTRRFLGMTGWYRRYIDNYAAVSAPITDTLKKADNYIWTPEAQEAFDKLKVALTTAPVLTHPDFSKPFFIQCDASITGVGGVLFQLHDGQEHPIAYLSKKLNSAQRNYSVTELECLAAILSVEKFRCYIEGMPFTIITDHASLKWLMGKRDLAGRLSRWSMRLQAFDFQIEHRKGSENVVPDTLSRIPVETLDMRVRMPMSLTDKAFKSEEYVKLARTVEERGEELPDMEVRDGVVFRRTEFRSGDEAVDMATVWKIWVPEDLRGKVISDAHDPSSASHGGVEKTVELIRRLYFWPGLSRDVRKFVGACEICKTTKAPNQTLRPPMGKSFPAVRTFQRLFMDLLGPYPRSKSGNTTILIVLDQVSKFVWLKPLKKATAKNIGQYLEVEIFSLVGAPESILTDNGVQFVSNDFEKLLKRYGIEHILTASHAPQANASERVNRSIVAAVRAYIDEDQSTWDQELAAITSALRNGTHTTTGHSPHYLVFGQHMVQHAGTYPLLRSLQALPDGDMQIMPANDFREVIMDSVRQNVEKANDRNRRQYDKRSKKVSYKPGQEVFIRNFRQSDFSKNFNAKLGRQWTPARIRSRKGGSVYVVEDRNGKLIKVAYHAKDIRV